MRRTILVCGAAALALAACSKAGDKQAANGAPAAGEAGKPAAANAGGGLASVDTPTRKVGLWEQTMTSERMHQTLRMCVDAATEQKAKWWRSEGPRGAAGVDCPEQSVSRTLTGGWKIHSVCKIDEMTVATDGTASGDFGSAYHVELTSVTTGSSMPQANGTHKMSMDGVWKGPCPAGWTGGDVELAGGMRMNVLNPDAGPPTMPGGLKPGERPSRAQIEQMRAMAEKMKAQSGAQ
jgi:hypothetical protein